MPAGSPAAGADLDGVYFSAAKRRTHAAVAAQRLNYPAGATPTMTATMLAISNQAATLSLVGQVSSMVLALLVGRFVLKSRSAIWVAAFAGAFGAMVANILVDGQGAFVLLIYAPVI